jgi:hypothetical protein
MQNLNMNDSHADKIRDIRASLATVGRRLILAASDINSVLTIIEGNHRAIAIFADALDHGAHHPIISEVFVGVSPNMRRYMFYIEQYIVPVGVQRPGP